MGRKKERTKVVTQTYEEDGYEYEVVEEVTVEQTIVKETINPREVRRRFEEGAGNEVVREKSVPRSGASSPVNIEDAKQRYLNQASSPTPPATVQGKDRKSLKKRKKFGRKRKSSSSSTSSSSSSSSRSDSDDISWDDLIDSRYTPLIIDLADWVGYVTGKKIAWEKFFDKIYNGVLLCDLCNSVNKLCNDPNLPKINMSTHTDKGKTFIRYNVEVYILWCRAFGVPELSLMDVSDLVDKKSVKMVLGTILAVGREMRARSLPCPVVAVLEQTYRMNYESMIDAVVEDDAIQDSEKIQDSVKLKRKRFQMIKSKAQSGSALTAGAIDRDSKNIQEDILCLMYLKGFKKGDQSAESVIKGWQGAVRSGDYRSATLPSNFKGNLERFESMDMRYGQTLPRNYGAGRSSGKEEDSDNDNQGIALQELKDYKSPDLSKLQKEKNNESSTHQPKEDKNRKISFGFGLGNIFSDKSEDEEKKKKEVEDTKEPESDKTAQSQYELTMSGDQFHAMRESGLLGNMLETYHKTEGGEYNVVLTSQQYQQFQVLIEHEVEAVSQVQADQKYDKKKPKRKDKDKRKSKSQDVENLSIDTNSPSNTPKVRRKSRLKRWGSKSSKLETSESETAADPNKKKRKSFSFSKKAKKDTSASEDGEKKRSSLFGKKKKNSVVNKQQAEELTVPILKPEDDTKKDKPDPANQFGVWPNIQTRLGDVDDPSLSTNDISNQNISDKINESEINEKNRIRSGSREKKRSGEKDKSKSNIDPRSRIPAHLEYKDHEDRKGRGELYNLVPDILAPDYKQDHYTSHDNTGGLEYLSNEELTDASEYSIVSYPIIGKRKRKKKRRRKYRTPAGTYSSDVSCFECCIMVLCPWRWVSSR